MFNEASGLEKNLGIVNAFLKRRWNGRYEIVCVNDGSEDETPRLLKRMEDSLPLRVENHETNRGKGAAIRTGMLAARGERVFFFDADLSTPLEEMERFLPFFDQGYDLVVGNRKSRFARIQRYQPLHRVILGLGYTFMVNRMLGLGFSDYTCGFKAFNRKAVDAIFPETRIERWSFDAEILYLAHRAGLGIREVPVTWENKPGSKVRLFRDTIRSFREVLQVRRMHRRKGTG
jgi:dolichyl-phosphate beta-glucosyltransferase